MGEITAVEERYKTLSNGAVYDMEKKRIVANPGGGKNAITKETASEMHAKRQEKKRRAIEAGATAAVMDRLPDAFTGDDGDWIEAVAQQVAYKALDKLDPKQVDAARFLLQEAGLADKQAVASPVEQMSDLLTALADFASRIAPPNGADNSYYRKHEGDTVEGTVTEDTAQAGEAEADKGDGG